jgi:hypothetical protein
MAKTSVYRTEETTKLDALYLWGWHKWEWPFKRGPLRKRIETVFWFQDMRFWSPKPEELAPVEEIKHSHLLVRKKKCQICNTDKNILTGEHPVVKVDA